MGTRKEAWAGGTVMSGEGYMRSKVRWSGEPGIRCRRSGKVEEGCGLPEKSGAGGRKGLDQSDMNWAGGSVVGWLGPQSRGDAWAAG